MIATMPAPKPTLVALRDQRERTIQILSDAFAADLFDIDEFETRLDSANQASTCEALIELRKDVDPSAAETALAIPSQETNQALVAAQPKSGWAIAVMGGSERKGVWRVPKKLRSVSVMGGVKLDFREAIFAPGVTELSVMAIMGGVEILVPPNLAVECNGIGVMGGFEGQSRLPSHPDPDQPILRIGGLALMGGVETKMRLVNESAKEAKKRRKQEKKALKRTKKPKQLS